MKGWIIGGLALVALLGLPFQKYETEKLLPILCLQAQRQENEIRILSEAGEGCGTTWEAAVRDLRQKAPGEVFFDTAEQAVFSDPELAIEAAESGDLRPAAEVFYRLGFEDPAVLYEYYSQHGSNLTVGHLIKEGSGTHG